jgi:hypothetical protein
MLIRNVLLSFLISVGAMGILTAQTFEPVSVQDSILKAGMVNISYGVALPGADLEDRYGFANMVGGEILIKNKKNWLTGVNATYLFGNTIKEVELFDNLITEFGGIIGNDGLIYTPIVSESGFMVGGKFGKILPVLSPNPNSGLTLIGGAGFMQHKIKIFTEEDRVPQLSGDYRKGYDRLTNGFMLQQYIGYSYFGQKRFINFQVGFEVTEGFTKSRRSYNYDTGLADDKARLDLLYALKVAWVLPIYEKPSQRYYYD